MTQDETSAPLVSCLCVTEDRMAFMPWLLWNFEKQTHARRELVVVDSSPLPFDAGARPNVRVVHANPGTSVPAKRNLALEQASGDVIAWFDDDDWQHPERLALLLDAFDGTPGVAGCRDSWFLDLWADRCAEYKARSGVIFNSAAFSRKLALSVRFDPKRRRGSDTVWMQEILRRSPGPVRLTREAPLSLWLCHERNLSNPRHRRRFDHRFEEMRRRIDARAWSETDLELDLLRRRLRPSAPARVSVPRIVPSVPARVAPTHDSTPVSVAIKATVLDAPYLGVMVPHMLEQMRHPVADRCVVVDGRNDFSGKYAARPRASRADLDRELDTLVQRGAIDRYVEVDYDAGRVADTMQRYFGQAGVGVPTHALTGGPIYPTLFALENAPTDHVVQMDADVFFHSSGGSWLERGLRALSSNERVWLAMTHPGPFVEELGRTKCLGPANARRATWCDALSAWEFQSATTRYFLADKRRLHGRLLVARQGNRVRPLEECISLALKQNGASRINLAFVGSWHLHAHHHGPPFPEWASRLARAVEDGLFPPSQVGKYDLRLDHEPSRRDWAELLGTPKLRSAIPARASRSPTASMAEIQATAPAASNERAPVSVVIPVRNRAGARVRNALTSLLWQSAGAPAEICVVSQGSSADFDRELEALCEAAGAHFYRIGATSDAWCKPLALNTGIRATSEARYLMTMDVDMILAPNLLEVALRALTAKPSSLVLCRSSDLPNTANVPSDPDALEAAFESLRRRTHLRGRHGTGGIQLAPREFFFDVRGYDEQLIWWGAMDGDMVRRAQAKGLEVAWIDGATCMLHQWHPKRFAALGDARKRAEASAAWTRNHALVRTRESIVRNPDHWGGAP